MLEPDLLGRFTTHLKEALQKALMFAIRHERFFVEPGDLVVGLLQEKGSIGAEILTKAHISLEAAESAFAGTPERGKRTSSPAPDLSPAVKRILEKCVLTAHLAEHKYVGTEHLVAALLDSSHPDINGFFESNGLEPTLVREQVLSILKSATRFPNLQGTDHSMAHDGQEEPLVPDQQGLDGAPGASRSIKNRRVRAIDVFTRELTNPEIVAQLDPVIGRETETERIIEILCRRMKNNPILLGEPGVGKTAIVEGLAQRLTAGDVPDALQGKRVYAADMALMVAGTMYRGEFEARMKQLVDELREEKNAILFIDEMHTIVGAGSTSGSLDAANILKPALARGEIRCIGATTWSEYKKHIEPDAALERRYQPVEVREPSALQTLEMIKGLKRQYEDHHGVRFPQETLDAAVRLADKHVTDRFFPDKAIDLLDETASRVAARRRSSEEMERLRALDIAISATQERKDSAVQDGDMDEASRAYDDEKRLQKEKKALEQRIKKIRSADRLTVTPSDIAEIVARMSHVPLQLVLADEHAHLQGLEDRLRSAILGQPMAVSEVSNVVRKARLGLSDGKRPKASFLFAGPSGVGKTELARTLALEIFGREDALVKIDMSEFAESHSVSKLLGSPAGYVGYRESNRLADAIKKHPHSVLLFDEFEKGHPDVQHLLLQALEDGTLTDATGRKLSLRHAYIVLTSNVGADAVNRTSMGFGDEMTTDARFEDAVREQLKDRFRPELLNRLDRIVVFRPLERDALKEILRRELESVFVRVKDAQNIAYSSGDDVLDWLLAQPMNREEGARAVRHVVEREIVRALSESLLKNQKKRTWKLNITKDGLKIR